jgi:catechol 2,3-dioxygenase-like lactoylglutathione lyase family enzyme
MTALACSHALLVSSDVPRTMATLRELFELKTHFENADFGEFVLPSGFRLAVFRPTGVAGKWFTEGAQRGGVALGLTVPDVDALWARIQPRLEALGLQVSGPPKEHPWGEKSFLLVDADGNRWEVAQSPSADGMLVDRGT